MMKLGFITLDACYRSPTSSLVELGLWHLMGFESATPGSFAPETT